MRIFPPLGVLLVACAGGDAASGDGREASQPPLGSTGTVDVVGVPTDWLRVESSCGYTFRAPPDLMPQTGGGVDSCGNIWATGNCVYSGDYGVYSSNLSEYEESTQYEATQESIGGHAAKVVTALFEEFLVAAVSFPSIDGESEGVKLTVWAECQDAAGQHDALRAFRTITFVP